MSLPYEKHVKYINLNQNITQQPLKRTTTVDKAYKLKIK